MKGEDLSPDVQGSEIDGSEGGQSSVVGNNLHPHVCAECHHAWKEKRFDDVGRHKVQTSMIRDEDCLLWKIISHGTSGGLGQEIKTVEPSGQNEDDHGK